MLTVRELYEDIAKECQDFPIIKYEDCNIELPHEQILGLKKCMVRLFNGGNKDYVKNVFNDIARNPTYKNGKIYEVLVYNWLQDTCVHFDLQPKILKDDCFKKNNYEADGKIGNTIFDVKTFGLAIPLLKHLESELQKSPKTKGYLITVSGIYHIPNKDVESMLKTKEDIIDELLSDKHNNHGHYIWKMENGIELRAQPKQPMVSHVGSFHSGEWAHNNEMYFFYHGSQFTRSKPYMIFCPFDNKLLPFFNVIDEVFWAFRFLTRRMFMSTFRFSNRMLNEFDEKAVPNISLEVAAKKISAIVFMDVTKEWNYNDCRTWVYVNPNADNKIKNYEIDQWFRQKGACVEDFLYDNY